ncbi:hypothetical protein [Streptomyces anulatus]|uniref:hypothetical protein n=1 Tax=Streptomyces anulatus TaxID=1892 RepID=UPI0004C48C5E|nr:hypothetical protein [Streptomyces anulatus]
MNQDGAHDGSRGTGQAAEDGDAIFAEVTEGLKIHAFPTTPENLRSLSVARQPPPGGRPHSH